jgi:hypothetical protein
MSVYPEHNWKVETSDRKPKGYWNDKSNQRKFFDQLALKLNVKKPEDWFSVRLQTVLDNGGSFVKTYYNQSLVHGLNIYYYVTSE